MTLITDETKVCKGCGRELPINAFAANIRAKDGRQPYCRDCMHERHTAAIADGGKKKKAKKQGGMPEPKAVNPELAKFKARDLIEELAARGYKGTLEYTFSVTL